MSSEERKSTNGERDADWTGAEAALGRASRRAQRRAREAAQRQAREKAGDTGGVETRLDPRKLTFSQVEGYEEIPKPLKLGEVPPEARTRIWNVFYQYLDESKGTWAMGDAWIGGAWKEILWSKHISHDGFPADEWTTEFRHNCRNLRKDIETLQFNKVFDLIQFILRHPKCPSGFVSKLKQVFVECRLAYTIDEGDPRTIIPNITEMEGTTIVESLATLRRAGLRGSAEHLRKACEFVNGGDWAGSIRESFFAVESVARTLAPGAKDVRPALASINRDGALHPALGDAFVKLYGYTSNEQGVRHALLDSEKAKVGVDEAVFMLGACAAFASYLWRKHTSGRVP